MVVSAYLLGLPAAIHVAPVTAETILPSGDEQMTPAELFSFADAARDRGDYDTAETAYRALATNPDIDLRSEARFRLAMMLADREKKYREAAVELRKILDEKPKVARVRLELARMDAMIGDLGAARRELRQAQASNLPPAVERLVRFYANALNAQKPWGASMELAIAPDSNVNRATRADRLETVIGDFTLNDDAKARSGIGLATRAQGYVRVGLSSKSRLLIRASESGNFYTKPAFDDVALSLQAGPEMSSGSDRLNLSAGPAWRWYGNKPYSTSYGVSGNWLHPAGKRGQLRLDASVTKTDNRFNDLQDGQVYSIAFGVDRAFSARFGGGFQIGAIRTAAADPGYSDASASTSFYLFHEFGRTTMVTTLSYAHLEADARLFLYTERRRDDRVGATLSATFRSLSLGTFAPYARLVAERNNSTVGIYSYNRVGAEFGITSAF